MALRSAALWLLVLEVVALQHMCLGSSSHSLKIVFFTILEPGQPPQFVILGYVDSQIFARYDSNSRKIQARVSWVEKSRKDIPRYWQALTDVARNIDDMKRVDLEHMRIHYNITRHLDMGIASCELQGDGSKRGLLQMSYPWDHIRPIPDSDRDNCIELLEKCLSYGKETLLTIETPIVTVSSRTEVEDGMETHICRVHGFYPKEINASWTRDREVWLQDTLHASVAPNADETYHYWLSIRIDPKEKDRYRCHVEHDSLQHPLDMALKVPESNLDLIIGCVVAALVLACVIAGTLILLRNHSRGRGELQGATSL